jgi:hypothetical protein
VGDLATAGQLLLEGWLKPCFWDEQGLAPNVILLGLGFPTPFQPKLWVWLNSLTELQPTSLKVQKASG